MSLETEEIRGIFDFYRSSLFTISNDITLWQTFFDNTLNEYIARNDSTFKYESIFNVYDLPHDSANGYLKTYKSYFKVSVDELPAYQLKFFDWVSAIAILKAYNSCELLLLRTIQLRYFPNLDNTFESRRGINKIHKQIKQALNNPDATNNRHVIKFLSLKSPEFATFSKHLVRTDSKTSWENFFELFSIIRNLITHNGSVVHPDTLNELKSKSQDIFERHFELTSENGDLTLLRPKRGDSFGQFLDLINDFSLNTAKFIFKQNDLEFLDMK